MFSSSAVAGLKMLASTAEGAYFLERLYIIALNGFYTEKLPLSISKHAFLWSSHHFALLL